MALTDTDKLLIESIARKEFKGMVAENKNQFKELKLLFNPDQVKREIKNIVSFVIKKELDDAVKTNIKLEVRKIVLAHFDNLVKEYVLEKMKKLDIGKILKNHFDNSFSNLFEPIMEKAQKVSYKIISSKINKTLKNLINLKTSTIMEIKNNINDQDLTNESESLKQLQIEFPEYYKLLEDGSR